MHHACLHFSIIAINSSATLSEAREMTPIASRAQQGVFLIINIYFTGWRYLSIKFARQTIEHHCRQVIVIELVIYVNLRQKTMLKIFRSTSPELTDNGNASTRFISPVTSELIPFA